MTNYLAPRAQIRPSRPNGRSLGNALCILSVFFMLWSMSLCHVNSDAITARHNRESLSSQDRSTVGRMMASINDEALAEDEMGYLFGKCVSTQGCVERVAAVKPRAR